MSKQILNCELAAREAMKAAIWERSMFCAIMGIGDGIYNSFIGGDPHGCADLQDGTYFFNMSDIHVVVSEYKRWLQYYGDNEGIARAVRQWYYLSLDWHEKHPSMEWIDAKKSLPIEECDYDGKHEFVLVKAIFTQTGNELMEMMACYSDRLKDWQRTDYNLLQRYGAEVTHWMKLREPSDTHFPNLRSWIMGCPVPGLREATEAYKEQHEADMREAHKRTEQAKAELEKEMEEQK